MFLCGLCIKFLPLSSCLAFPRQWAVSSKLNQAFPPQLALGFGVYHSTDALSWKPRNILGEQCPQRGETLTSFALHQCFRTKDLKCLARDFISHFSQFHTQSPEGFTWRTLKGISLHHFWIQLFNALTTLLGVFKLTWCGLSKLPCSGGSHVQEHQMPLSTGANQCTLNVTEEHDG